jgi:hypothetical protein
MYSDWIVFSTRPDSIGAQTVPGTRLPSPAMIHPFLGRQFSPPLSTEPKPLHRTLLRASKNAASKGLD